MTVRIPPFISRFEEPSCWCRLEPRKRRANWKLIPVWVPEMSAACVIPGAFVHSHHILRPWMRLCPFSAWFWEFSLLRAHQRWSERARCPPIITGASIITGCYSHWWRQTSDWLLHNLKGNVGKGFVSVQIPGLTLGLTHDRGGKSSLLPSRDRVFRNWKEWRLNRIPPVGMWKTINRLDMSVKTPSIGCLFAFLSVFYSVFEDNANTLTFSK